MKTSFALFLLSLASASLVGCSQSTGGGSDPKPVGNTELKPLPPPGSPAGGGAPAPKNGKGGAGVPGAGSNVQ